MKTATTTNKNDIANFLAELTYAHANATSDASINPSVNVTVKEIEKAHKLGLLEDRYYETNRTLMAIQTLREVKSFTPEFFHTAYRFGLDRN